MRERQGDVGLLTKYFVDEYKADMHKNIIGVSHDVMKIFQTYFWPGNVRELKNVIEGAFNLCDSTIIGIGDLPAYMLTDIEVDTLTAETPYGEQVLHDSQSHRGQQNPCRCGGVPGNKPPEP